MTEPLSIVETWADEAACAARAARWARNPLLASATLALEGELGAGKTTFVRHLLHALGIKGRIKSPTYAVMEPYTVPAGRWQGLAVAHFDFYRFADPREWEDAGLRDVFAAPGLKVCEWTSRLGNHAPPATASLDIAIEPDGTRRVRITAHTPDAQELLA